MFLAYSKALKKGAELDPSAFLAEQSDPNELKLLVYTSGTTGFSKGVMLSEHNLVSSVYYGLMVSTVYDTGLSLLPYHHTYEAKTSKSRAWRSSSTNLSKRATSFVLRASTSAVSSSDLFLRASAVS